MKYIKSSKLKDEWYLKEDILNRMLMFTRFKEIALIGKTKGTTTSIIRYLRAWKLSYFKDLLKRFNNYENISIYISIANTKLPFIPYFIEQRKTDKTYLEMKEKYTDYVVDYDLVFDFDAPLMKNKKDYNINLVKRDVIKLSDYLDRSPIKHRIIFSGNRGFQLTITSNDTKYIMDLYGLQKDKILDGFKEYAIKLKKKLDLKTLDTDQFKPTQLVKLPYSYCNGYICAILNKRELRSFKKENYSVKQIFEA